MKKLLFLTTILMLSASVSYAEGSAAATPSAGSLCSDEHGKLPGFDAQGNPLPATGPAVNVDNGGG